MSATNNPVPEAAPAGTRISLFPVLLVNFIGALGFSLVIPFLVFLVTGWGGNAVVYGLLVATYPTFQFIGAPILGRWSDTHGRRKILLVSQAGTLLAWCVFLVALFLPNQTVLTIERSAGLALIITLPMVVLFFSRAMDGLTGGNIAVANAYVADVTPEAERGKNFGKMAVASNLGFVLGPALAGVLGSTSLKELLPVLAAVGISAVATWIIAFRLPESKPCLFTETEEVHGVGKILGHEEQDCFESDEASKLGWRGVLKLPRVTFLLILYFLIFLGFNLFYTSFPVFAVQTLNWQVRDTGMFFSLLSGMMVIVQGPVLARLSKRVADEVLVLVGGLILGSNFVLLTTGQTFWVYMAAVCFAVGNGLMWPSFLSVLSRSTTARYQGMVQGLAGSVGSLSSIIGLILGGFLFEALNGATFFLSAGVIFLSCLLSLRLLQAPPQPEVEPVAAQ